jgi:CheY-like chemotaxis protein
LVRIGTEFKQEEAVESMDAAGVPDGNGHRRRLVILVAEDEVLVRAAASHQLRSLGYAVIEAGDASQALEVLQSQIQVDLVFTDITMPGLLNGADLARVVMSEYPATRVMMTSGVIGSAPDLAALPVLHKPYSFDELQRQVEQLIGKPDPGAW